MLLWASGGQYTNHLLITLRRHISQPSRRGGPVMAFRSSVPSSHSSRPSTRGCRGLSFLSLTQFPILYKRMSCPFVSLSLTFTDPLQKDVVAFRSPVSDTVHYVTKNACKPGSPCNQHAPTLLLFSYFLNRRLFPFPGVELA